jgi:hypothetical protein
VSETTPVDTSGSPHTVVTGASSATIGGLEPGKTYRFVARARDEAGNLSTGAVERTATTPAADPADTVAPDFAAGNVQVTTQTSASNMSLTWTAATDANGAANVRYHVCASMTQTDCQGADFFRHVVVTTTFGAVNVMAAFLTPRTDYFFFVRAEDRAGNVSEPAPFKRLATATSFATNVQPILAARCGACHDYTKVSALGDITRINPPNLKTSPFSDSVPNEYGGLQEPRDTQDKLSGSEDDAIRTWIAQGAAGN